MGLGFGVWVRVSVRVEAVKVSQRSPASDTNPNPSPNPVIPTSPRVSVRQCVDTHGCACIYVDTHGCACMLVFTGQCTYETLLDQLVAGHLRLRHNHPRGALVPFFGEYFGHEVFTSA